MELRWSNFERFLGSLIILLFFTVSVHAQLDLDGWKLVRENDFVQAKKGFENSLKTNPEDIDALIGLIFISETIQDYNSYKKYIKALIEAGYDENYLRLFGHMYEADPGKMLEKNLNETQKAYYRNSLADTLLKERKFEESRKLRRKYIGDYNWSVIGPFSNISGSGFIKAYPPENTPFSNQAVYKNDEGMELKWQDNVLRNPDGLVSFPDVLFLNPESVYYANTFLEIPSDRVLQFRIMRSQPMKIWLDDDLVFENNSNTTGLWDNEIVELKVSKGNHRLLIKCANYSDRSGSNNISLDFYNQSDYGDGFMSPRTDEWGNHTYDNYSQQQGFAQFGIRLTDNEGKLYEDINSSFLGDYQQAEYDERIFDSLITNYFKSGIEKDPGDLKQYYLLCKAYYIQDGSFDEGEAFFYNLYQKHKGESFFHFLLARFYASNGKGQKAEELISGQDDQKVPFLALMNAEHAKIDQEKNESQYLASLDKMLRVSPTNWSLISNYLDFYQKKGKTEEKRRFIQSFLEKYPDKQFKKRLEPYLENESYKPTSYKPTTDKEREKVAKRAIKRIKRSFNVADYYTAIGYFKRLEKKGEVLKLYNELISIFPYEAYWYKEKSKYLFESDQLDSALQEIQKALNINIYQKDIYETIGDIYFEKNNKEEALKNYLKAKELLGFASYAYGKLEIEEKINKIREKSSVKAYFNSISFEEALKDESWKSLYPEDESVILLYTIESALDEENNIDYSQKMMVYIQNDAGAKYWTEANFSFLGDINFVKVLKKDGRVTSPDRSYGYVVFKNLEAGDIIQIEGNSKANMNMELKGEMFHIAAISHDFPVYKAKMEFIHPKDLELFYECYRLDCTADVKVKDQYKILSWEYENVPKMEREEAIQDDLDNYAWMMFSTQNNWSEVVDWYIEKTYRRLETNYEIESELLGILKDGLTEQEVVERIYNYVTEKITYSFVGFLNSNYIPKKPSSTISDQIGDCKDVASLMITMLRQAGIEAYYVLVRSSNYTSKKPLPTIAAFNHVVVGYVLSDGIMRYVDLTTDYYPHYVIPEFDNNSWALLIKEGENDIFQLPNDMLDPNKSRLEISIDAQINSDRSLDMTAFATGKGVLGGKTREALNRVTTQEERKKYLTDYFGEGAFDHLTINDFEFQDLEVLTAPIKINLNLKAYNHIEKVSNFFIVQIPLLKSITTEPILFAQKRYNNLDLHALFETAPTFQDVHLDIPESFDLMEMPENVTYDNKFGTYSLKFEKTDKGIRIKRSLMMKTRLVDFLDYEQFKHFYFNLLDADRTKLAIVKR